MPTPSVTAHTRPVRVGWCVPHGSFADLRVAIRSSHLLWGGRYHPILPVGPSTALSAQLVKLFRVDVLHATAPADREVRAFVDGFGHLRTPFFRDDVVADGENGAPLLLDIRPVVEAIRDEQLRSGSTYHPSTIIPVLEEDDPLHDVLLAMLGAFPQTPHGILTEQLLVTRLNGALVRIEASGPLLPGLFEEWNPNKIGRYSLDVVKHPSAHGDGFYCGSVSDFDDVVNFWNLRALGLGLCFFDGHQVDRMQQLTEKCLKYIEAGFPDLRDWDRHVALYRRTDTDSPETSLPTMQSTLSEASWNGFNLRPGVFGVESALTYGELSSGGSRAALSVPIQPLRFVGQRSEAARQHVIVDLKPRVYHPVPGGLTFDWFNLPQLNEHYSRKMLYSPSGIRLSDNGLGVILAAGHTRVELNALHERELAARILAHCGIDAQMSKPGLVTSRLVAQMGGVQGCRVFKIRGVRALIQKHDPLESFTRGEATQLIADIDPTSNQPRFDDYERLFIEYREAGLLTPSDTFAFLLKKEILRVGLDLECPYCQLKFWRELDAITVIAKCEYCGDAFNISGQLKDRDWRFRRSGLFGQKDNQHGAIPVALTLQQLDTNLSYDQEVMTASWTLSGPGIATCETDLLVVGQRPDGRVQIAVGECKAFGPITEDDVRKLLAVADRIEATDLEPFLVFSKTSSFEPAEILLCQGAQTEYRSRVILLGSRELEPYLITGRTSSEFDTGGADLSLEGLAKVTESVYFNPKPKV